MKILPLCSLGLLATLAILPGRAAAQGANDNVRIEAHVVSETEKKEPAKDAKAAREAARTENKTIQISITGKPKNPETRTGHWTIYGREAKGHDVMTVDSGDFKIELPASGPQKLESKKVSITFTPEHLEGGGKGKAGKKIDATGTKYVGYGVVVKDGDKVVGETFDPMGVKTEANK